MKRGANRGLGRRAALVLGALAALGSLGSLARRWRRKEAVAMAAMDNKTILRRLFEEPWKGNFDVIDEFVDANYVGYDPSNPEPLRGPQGVKDFVQQYRSAFSDARIMVDDQIAEGDMVATRWTGRGTHDGALMGIPPTQKQATVSGLTMSRLQNGRVIEEWTNWDTLGMLQQLGAVPEMARA